MGIEGRFQEYAESYLSGKHHRTTADIPIHEIKHTPIAVLYGDADQVCTMDSVETMMSDIGHMVYANYQFGGYDHADFGTANDQVFMEELHEALSHLRPHEGHIISERFEEDLEHALTKEYEKEERDHEWREDHRHEYSGDEEIGYDDYYSRHSDYSDDDHYDMVHLPEPFLHERTYAEEQEEEARWRDDKNHGHDTGFDLRKYPHEYEEDHFYQ
jgi:hypothetical protein